MPRRRTSNRPLKRRIRLETQGDIMTEMCRRYRAGQHGDSPRADVVRDIVSLDKIRSGMPDDIATVGGGTVVINLFGVPPGHHQCPDGNYRPEAEAVVLWREHHGRLGSEETSPLMIEHDNHSVVAFPLPEHPKLAALEAELNNLSYDELLVRARQCGLVDNVE